MRMTQLIALICLCLVTTDPSRADETTANRIFVQALHGYRSLPAKAPELDRIQALENLLAVLEKIVSEHPDSRLAVEILSGQHIGEVNPTALREEYEDDLWNFCQTNSDKRCMPFLKRLIEAKRKTDRAFSAEKKLLALARRRESVLNRQLAALRQQLARIEAVLQVSELKTEQQQAQVVDLGRRLNLALASKVHELARYRSEFFGRLREVLGDREDIRVVGDRFVFQSEVLFDSGSADMQSAGRSQIASLTKTLLEISGKIPKEINWVLRVDGHTDRRPIMTARFPSNWELSSARAISVVRQLIEQGIPAARLVAAGFGENQPLDIRADEIALRRNRRIEFKLTER